MQFESYTLKISFHEMSIRFRLVTCFNSFLRFDQMSCLLMFCVLRRILDVFIDIL